VGLKYVDRKKVETPHNYYPNTDEETVVTIPGATHLCITFDDRCSLVTCSLKKTNCSHYAHFVVTGKGQ